MGNLVQKLTASSVECTIDCMHKPLSCTLSEGAPLDSKQHKGINKNTTYMQPHMSLNETQQNVFLRLSHHLAAVLRTPFSAVN